MCERHDLQFREEDGSFVLRFRLLFGRINKEDESPMSASAQPKMR